MAAEDVLTPGGGGEQDAVDDGTLDDSGTVVSGMAAEDVPIPAGGREEDAVERGRRSCMVVHGCGR